VVQGSKTILGYSLSADARSILGASGQVLIRLPSMARQGVLQLLGILQDGPDIEAFVGWTGPLPELDNHLEVFRGRSGAEAEFVHDFTLPAGPFLGVSFFQPPDARDAPAVLAGFYLGSLTSTTYVLAPDRQSIEKLFDATSWEFSDLDRDGVYELIAWPRDGGDRRGACAPGFIPSASNPELFVRAGASYRKVWPPPDWFPSDDDLQNHRDFLDRKGASYQISAGFADLRGDGATELVVVQDRALDEPTQSLAIYRLESNVLRLVAQTSLPPQRPATILAAIHDSSNGDSSDGREIMVRTATPPPCPRSDRYPGIEDTGFILRGDRLQPVQP
jgi:hypothetical protein